MKPLHIKHRDVLRLLPDRTPEAHKGTCGKLLLICGSRGYTGAPVLAAMGALRTGAGLVYLAVPESIYPIVAGKTLEPVVIPVPDHNGMIAADAVSKLETLVTGMDVVLIGPGLGQSEDTFSVTKWILENFDGPVVLDADGINVIREHKDLLRNRTSPTILTPHPGEFTGLCGQITDDRWNDTFAAAKDLNAIILLKGHRTVISDGQCGYINKTGNPGMAVGGSGDVLSGVIAALLGFGLAPLQAAACGAWLHGAAGDICRKKIGEYGMLPSDMIDVLPRLLK